MKRNSPPKDPHSVPTPRTPERCEPTPTEDTGEGRDAKPCPEGYPEEQPTDEPGKGRGRGDRGSERAGG